MWPLTVNIPALCIIFLPEGLIAAGLLLPDTFPAKAAKQKHVYKTFEQQMTNWPVAQATFIDNWGSVRPAVNPVWYLILLPGSAGQTDVARPMLSSDWSAML